MPPRVPEEKIKPFQLVKYFTFTGLVVIFLVTLILTILNTHWVKSMQRKKSEDYEHALIENLNHQVFLQFILPIGIKYGKVQLRNQEQFERMDNVVRSTLHSFKVEDLNIYSMNNTISYSFDEARIGINALGGTAFEQAKSGRSSSKLVQRGSFMEILLGSGSRGARFASHRSFELRAASRVPSARRLPASSAGLAAAHGELWFSGMGSPVVHRSRMLTMRAQSWCPLAAYRTLENTPVPLIRNRGVMIMIAEAHGSRGRVTRGGDASRVPEVMGGADRV